MTTRVDIQKENFDNFKFPKVCPVCGIENPDSSLDINTFLTINQPFNEPMFKNWKVHVPVCSQHKRNITLGRWISRLLFLGLVLIVTVILIVLWNFMGDQGTWINLGVLIVLLSVAIIAHAKLYTAPLLVESFSYRILFTFKDEKLAEKFARLNGITRVYDSLNQGRDI